MTALIEKGYPKSSEKNLIETYQDLILKIRKRKIEDYRLKELKRFERINFKPNHVDLIAPKIKMTTLLSRLINDYNEKWITKNNFENLKVHYPKIGKIINKTSSKSYYQLPLSELQRRGLKQKLINDLKNMLKKETG